MQPERTPVLEAVKSPSAGDATAAMLRTREAAGLKALLTTWPDGKWWTARELEGLAMEQRGRRGPWAHPQFRRALLRVAGTGDWINTRLLRQFLFRNGGREASGLRLHTRGSLSGGEFAVCTAAGLPIHEAATYPPNPDPQRHRKAGGCKGEPGAGRYCG
jgi:hypothetical protein